MLNPVEHRVLSTRQPLTNTLTVRLHHKSDLAAAAGLCVCTNMSAMLVHAMWDLKKDTARLKASSAAAWTSESPSSPLRVLHGCYSQAEAEQHDLSLQS